jgi:hypothetical protein
MPSLAQIPDLCTEENRCASKEQIMPALNFKKQFAEDVEFGNKRQTVRAPRKDGRPHCKSGDTIKLYTGMRTKDCRLLGEATVLRAEPVRIEATCMYLNGPPTAFRDHFTGPVGNYRQRIRPADGFGGFTEMANWFDDTHGLPFEGTVIYWDEPR